MKLCIYLFIHYTLFRLSKKFILGLRVISIFYVHSFIYLRHSFIAYINLKIAEPYCANISQSECQSRGSEFNPSLSPYAKIDHKIFSTVILLLMLILEGLLSVTCESMCMEYWLTP